jgi:sucrose-phosphate synthase
LKVILEKGISNNNQWKIWSRNGIEGVNRHFSWNTHVRNYL